MGSLVVELADERIEARLLLQAVHSGWSGRFLLERQVHALVPAVLLRMAGLDALDGDAQAQPPYGQLGEVEQRIGTGDGDAVVGADGARQAALEEQLLKGGDRRVFAR